MRGVKASGRNRDFRVTIGERPEVSYELRVASGEWREASGESAMATYRAFARTTTDETNNNAHGSRPGVDACIGIPTRETIGILYPNKHTPANGTRITTGPATVA